MRTSAVETRMPRPDFDDGEWHTLGELEGFEHRLSETRQADKSFSDAVRIDTARAEKLRHAELIPFLYFARQIGLPGFTRFRKPISDRGVDIEFEVDGGVSALQITTAYPMWGVPSGPRLSGGYQYRLHMEKLTSEGSLSGSGPFKRKGDTIGHNGDCNSWQEIEEALRAGMIEAFRGKQSRGDKTVSLLIHAVDYYFSTLKMDRFVSIITHAARIALPHRFASVIVVDYGPGYIHEIVPS